MLNSISPKICVVVPVRNRLNLTLKFIDSFKKCSYKNYTIVIIDDASTDNTVSEITEKYPDIVIIKGNGNLWWTGGTNKRVKYAITHKFDYVLTINNDAIVKDGYLESLVKTAIKYLNSIIGSVILENNSDTIWSIGAGTNWGSFYVLPRNFEGYKLSNLKEKISNPYKVEIALGDGTLIPISIYTKIGLYDSSWFPHYHADTEFSLRALKAGFNIYIDLNAVLENEVIPGQKLVKRRRDIIFSKKSDMYWRALFMLYLRYAPRKYKLHSIMQYYPDFHSVTPFKQLRSIKSKFKNLVGYK